MNTYYDYELDARLHNSLGYYRQLAGETVSAFTPLFKPANRDSFIELKAKAVHKEMWEYLEDRPAFTGNTLSHAKQQMRADCEALRQKRDAALGERAAIGRAKVMQQNLLAALKQVKKLSPTQKMRKETGCQSDYYDAMFNTVTLHFKGNRVHIDLFILDEKHPAQISLIERFGCTLDSASFSMTINWRDLEEIVKLLDKEVVTLRKHDWINKCVIQQKRNITRLTLHSNEHYCYN